MKKVISLIVLAAFVSTGFLISFSTDAEAIPAFARKEGAECTLCHVGFPKLNSFGYEYKQRGYRMEDDDGVFVWEYPTMQFAGMGALGFRYMDMDRPGMMQDATQANIQVGELEFFAGGNLGPKVSFFLDFEYEDHEVHRGGTFVILDDILPDAMLNLKVGAQDATWYWLNPARKLGMTGYLDTAKGFDGESVEINGMLPSQTRYQIGIGNDGVGTNSLGDSSTDWSLNQFYVVVDQTFEFMGEPRLGFTWVNNRIGTDNDNITGGTDTTERTNLLGASLNLDFPAVNLIFAYFNFDDDPTVGSTGDYDNWLVEAIVPIGDKILIEAFYEDLDIDGMRVGDQNVWGISGHYYIVPNVDIIADYSQTDTEMAMGKMDMDMFMLMFHIGF